MSDAQHVVDRVAADARRQGRRATVRDLRARSTTVLGTPPPDTWVEAVVDEALHGRRYVVGPVQPQQEPDEPVLGWDRVLAWPWDGSPRTSAAAAPSRPLLVARVGAWVVLAVVTARVWTGRWR